MGDYSKSDYAKNKQSQDIIYPTVMGIVRITQKDFLIQNPNYSVNDFKKFKRISDKLYKIIDRNDTNHAKHKVSLDKLNDSMLFYLSHNSRNLEEIDIFDIALNTNILTTIEKRRLKLFLLYRYNYTKISKIENVSEQAISKTMKSIVKKIKNIVKY